MSVTDLAATNVGPRRGVQAHSSAYLTIAAGHAPRGEIAVHPATLASRCRIFVRNLQIEARIGVYDWEKAAPQPVVVDLEFGLASDLACQTDRLGDAIDYAEVVARLRRLATDRHYQLVESMAEAMALVLQREFGVPWLVLSLSKLAPFPGAAVGIVVERGDRP